jgi:hypothetical protein
MAAKRGPYNKTIGGGPMRPKAPVTPPPHTCRFTPIAPEAVHDDPEHPFVPDDFQLWEWCIGCGKLRLGKLTFSPGPHQTKALYADQE